MTTIDQQKIEEVLSRGVKTIIGRGDLKSDLESGKKLRIKFGIDPTSSDLHLGHSIVLRKLKEFQELGCQIILLIGDFTATIGDPSGKSATRPTLTKEQVKKNMKDYLKQAGKILDIKKTKVRYNTEWFNNKTMPIEKFYSELARIESIGELMTRSMFRERQEKGELLTLSEFTYPLLQAYDSVMLEAEVELGGEDQMFNMLHGRRIQEKFSQKPQYVIGLELLVGLDGVNKMSKSLGNHIGLNDAPSDVFGKIMSISDDLIQKYCTLLTDLNYEEIRKIINPRDQKAVLAKEIVKMYHGEKAAAEAAENFIKIFRRHETPEDIKIFETDKKMYPILDLLCDSGLALSKNDAKRVVEGGGVQIEIPMTNDQAPKKIKVQNWHDEIKIEDGMVIQFGKRKFVQIKLKK